MRWNLRPAAADHGIWEAPELQHLRADDDLVIPVVVVCLQHASAGDRAARFSRPAPGTDRTP